MQRVPIRTSQPNKSNAVFRFLTAAHWNAASVVDFVQIHGSTERTLIVFGALLPFSAAQCDGCFQCITDEGCPCERSERSPFLD
jgi:hypothetical protein